jgi:D-sedoheptulose 7-phosphate isomerase
MIIDKIKQNFIEAQQVLETFILDPETSEKMDRAGKYMVEALKNGGKIISCGNGGSMCDAMHFAEELTGRFQKDRPPLAAMAISDPSHMTCVANDFGLDYIFSRTIDALGKPGDVLLAISTSGNSQNLINAVESAQKAGMKVIGLTGKSGGRMAELCDVEIRAPYSQYSDRVQEIHIKVIHSLVEYIELSMLDHLIESSKYKSII